MSRLRPAIQAVLALYLMQSSLGEAAEAGAAVDSFKASANVASEYHTNVRGDQEGNERSGAIFLARLDASGGHEGESYGWSLNGEFNLREYQHELLDEDFRAKAVGNARWLIVPSSFEWHLDYVESSRLIDPAQPNVGSNTESVRTFGTGPNLLLRLTSLDTFSARARHQLVQSGSNDYGRNAVSARLARQVRPRHQLFVNGDAVESLYDGIQPDYRIENIVGGYAYTGIKLAFSVDGGKSVLREEGFDDQFQDIGSAKVQWKINESRSIILNARQIFSDQGSELYFFSDGSNQGSLSASSAARERYADILYVGDRLWFDPAVAVWGMEKDYVRELPGQLDLDEAGARVTTRLEINNASYIQMKYRHLRRNFIDIDRVDIDREVFVTLVRNVRSRLVLSLYSGWFKRESSDIAAEYTDVSIGAEAEVRIR